MRGRKRNTRIEKKREGGSTFSLSLSDGNDKLLGWNSEMSLFFFICLSLHRHSELQYRPADINVEEKGERERERESERVRVRERERERYEGGWELLENERMREAGKYKDAVRGRARERNREREKNLDEWWLVSCHNRFKGDASNRWRRALEKVTGR